MRNIFLVIMILFSTSVYAQKQQIEVVSRFDTSKTTAIVAMEFIRILNKTQTKFEFRLTNGTRHIMHWEAYVISLLQIFLQSNNTC